MRLLFKYGICFLFFSTCLLVSGISQIHKDSLLTSIKILQNDLAKAELSDYNDEKAAQLVKKCLIYVDHYPKDTLSQQYLFMAADVSRGLKDYKSAVQYWQQYDEEYPNTALHPMSIFLQGFTYQENMNQPKMAKSCFNKFLKEYPEHELARDAKVYLIVVEESIQSTNGQH